jgi:hypothetical protein
MVVYVGDKLCVYLDVVTHLLNVPKLVTFFQ